MVIDDLSRRAVPVPPSQWTLWQRLRVRAWALAVAADVRAAERPADVGADPWDLAGDRRAA